MNYVISVVNMKKFMFICFVNAVPFWNGIKRWIYLESDTHITLTYIKAINRT